MPFVQLGNPAPTHPGGEAMDLEGKTELVTTSWQPPSYTLDEMVHNLAHPAEGQWNAHSTARRPSWVWSDDLELAQALAEAFGCPVSETPAEVAGP